MKPAPFDYARPESLEEAVALLADVGAEARVIAGGQSLVAMLNMRLARPALLVDVMHLPGMAEPRIEKDRLLIPCAVRQAALARRGTLAGEVPLLAAALPWVGHPQTRARGTLCGSVAHADPSAELPLVLVALEGVVHLRGRRRREVGAAGFFLGTMLTERADDELIEAVSLPLTPPGTGTAFAEIGRRRGDFAIVACAAVARERHLRLAVGGVNDTPALREWDGLDDSQMDDALNDFAWSLDARDDLHATARYRRDLVRELGRRTLEEARRCAA